MAGEYKVAFIGCGKRAHVSAIGVVADARCQTVGFADLSEEAALALKEKHGFDGKVYANHGDLLEKEKPDVVVSSLWTGLHLPIFRDCAEAGVKVVMSEKPMAASWKECLEMASIAEKTGCVLTFCHQRRFARGNLIAKSLIQSGAFGQIKRMEMFSPCDLLDCGTHSIDQAASFNEETPAKWVLGGIDVSEVGQHFGLPSETMFIGQIVYQNGVRATIQAKGPDREMPTGLRVEGTNGLIEVGWDGQFGQAVVFDDPSWKPPAIPEQTENVQVAVVRETLNSFEKGEEPVLSYKKALHASEIIFGLYESARSRRRVEFPLAIDDHPLEEMAAPKA